MRGPNGQPDVTVFIFILTVLVLLEGPREERIDSGGQLCVAREHEGEAYGTPVRMRTRRVGTRA